jgi:magnesium transporter
MQKSYQLQDGKLIESKAETAQVFVYANPDDSEKAFLINTLLIDEHTLNSSLDPDELGRVEFESTHTAVIVKRPRRFSSSDNFLLKVSSIGLFLFTDKLIIISPDEFAFEGRIFNKLRSIQDTFLKVIFSSIRHFEDHLLAIHKMSDELELEINQAMSNKDLFHMFNLEKSLVYYINAINSNGGVIEKLKFASTKIGFSADSVEFLEDVIIENSQCYQQADTYSEVLSSMMDARASIINNNLNIRIKTLTILSICIMMPTLIVSLFSMNTVLPIPHDAPWSFWLVSGVAALSVVIIMAIWRLRRW